MSRGLFRAFCACLVAVAALGAVACVPQDKGAAREVADARSADPVPTPPQFPDTGPVPPELLVKGLIYDFTSVPNDLDLWVPPTEQATCAAQKIVSTLGAARLSELGYRPATSGASLNDIDLTASERDSVAVQFQSCVDMTEGIAALLMGNGHMSSSSALCISKGLASKQLLAPFVEAWAFGRAVDPFKDDAALTEAILSYSAVCLNSGAFTWNDANLPGDDQVQGSANSAGTTTSTVPGTPDGLSSRIPRTTTAP